MRVGCSCRLQLHHTWIELARRIIGESTLYHRRIRLILVHVFAPLLIRKAINRIRINHLNKDLTIEFDSYKVESLFSARYIKYFETVLWNSTIARIAHLERIHAEYESLGGLKVVSCQSTIKTDKNVRLSILRKNIAAHIFMYLVSSV